jgi:hypothetical protein
MWLTAGTWKAKRPSPLCERTRFALSVRIERRHQQALIYGEFLHQKVAAARAQRKAGLHVNMAPRRSGRLPTIKSQSHPK